MSDELDWLSPRQRDGGVDRIPLPEPVPGQLWLCGKHAIAPELEAVSGDPADRSLRSFSFRTVPPATIGRSSPIGSRSGANPNPANGWTTVVCLTERHELAHRYPGYVRWLERAGERALWWPIPDMHAPPLGAMLPFVDDLVGRLQRGDSILVHCGAGIGRAGTTAVCVLIRLGMGAVAAEQTVADNRPMAGPEVGAQRDLVSAFQSLSGT